MHKGILVVISAPSGAGKTTLVRGLQKMMPEVLYSISMTTRSPRKGEKEGEDYRYVTLEEFNQRRNAGGFIEYAEVHGYWYGTPKDFVEKCLRQGDTVLLDIDVQGGSQIKTLYPDAVLVFIAPPSIPALETRLRERGQDDEPTIQKRLENAKKEFGQTRAYDYLIVNEKISDALDQLRCIITTERLRMQRSEPTLTKILTVP